MLEARKKNGSFGLVRCNWVSGESSSPGYIGQNTLAVAHLTANMETVDSDRWQHKKETLTVFIHAWNCQSQMDNFHQSSASPTKSVMRRHPEYYVQTKVLISLMTWIPSVLFKMNFSQMIKKNETWVAPTKGGKSCFFFNVILTDDSIILSCKRTDLFAQHLNHPLHAVYADNLVEIYPGHAFRGIVPKS